MCPIENSEEKKFLMTLMPGGGSNEGLQFVVGYPHFSIVHELQLETTFLSGKFNHIEMFQNQTISLLFSSSFFVNSETIEQNLNSIFANKYGKILC